MVVTVGKKWNAEFKQAGSLEDDLHWRRLITIMTQETVAKIRDVIMADRRVTECYIATELGISQDRSHAVNHNKLQMSKVSARCVPKLPGPDLKRTRLNMSRGNLVTF